MNRRAAMGVFDKHSSDRKGSNGVRNIIALEEQRLDDAQIMFLQLIVSNAIDEKSILNSIFDRVYLNWSFESQTTVRNFAVYDIATM